MEFQRGGASGCARPAIAAIDSDGLYRIKTTGKNNRTTLGFVFVNSGGFIFLLLVVITYFSFRIERMGTANQLNGPGRNSNVFLMTGAMIGLRTERRNARPTLPE